MNPVIPPRPAMAYEGGVKPPTPSPPLPERGQSLEYSQQLRRREPPPPPHFDADWEARETMRIRELEEARARAAQMEKTMRWWSDCTANWREKWSKVRNERNKAREEARHLRQKLEAAIKECASLKSEKEQMSVQIESLTNQMSGEKDGEGVASSLVDTKTAEQTEPSVDMAAGDAAAAASGDTVSHTDQMTFMDRLMSKKEKDSDSASNSSGGERRRGLQSDQTPTPEGSLVEEKLSMLQLKLEEAQKTIQAERDEKTQLGKTIDNLQEELTASKEKYQELNILYQQVSQEMHQIREEHQKTLCRMELELEDESNSRTSKDRRLADLRKELERLQAENAAEWGKRERLETEKLSLERENKKLKSEISHLEESLERKSKLATNMLDGDLRTLQHDLAERTKELGDLKHAHSKLKKLLQEKATDMEHAMRRAEQYELEVKKLRGRIEELKHDLTSAEDEADQQANQVRRLQRTNDELQEQVENLQVQVEHLQARLKRSSQPLMTSRSSSMKSFDPNDESTDALSDDDDDEMGTS